LVTISNSSERQTKQVGSAINCDMCLPFSIGCWGSNLIMELKT